MGITHATVAVGTDAGTGEIHKAEWNAAHVVSDLPGSELDYAQITSQVPISASTAATADTIVTGNAITYDGSTTVMIEFYAPWVETGAGGAGFYLDFFLFDGSTRLGEIAYVQTPSAAVIDVPLFVSRRLTPSAGAHTYSIRCNRGGTNGIVGAGTGAINNSMPAFIRITRV